MFAEDELNCCTKGSHTHIHMLPEVLAVQS